MLTLRERKLAWRLPATAADPGRGRLAPVHGPLRVDRAEFGVTASRGLAGRHLELDLNLRCLRASFSASAAVVH